MEPILKYLFWSSAYLVLLAVIYRFAVKPRCGAEFARRFVVVGSILSLVLPLVGLPLEFSQGAMVEQQGLAPEFLVLPEFVVAASGQVRQVQESIEKLVSSRWILTAILLLVSAFMLIRNLLGLALIASKVLKHDTQITLGMPTVFLPGQTSPFSFFNLVFVPIELKNSPTLHFIIRHEEGHYKKLHTLDLILLEFMAVLLWFNPAIWYLRSQLKLQHEYAADNYVMQSELSKTEYQHALLNVAFYKNYLPMVASFNYHSLKNRIVMMKKNTKTQFSNVVLSTFFATILFGGIMLLHSCQSKPSDKTLEETSEQQAVGEIPLPEIDENEPVFVVDENEPIFNIVDEQPIFPGGEKGRIQFLRNNLNYPIEARNKGIQGVVFVTFVVEKDGSITNPSIFRGIGAGCDEEVLRIMELMPKWNPGLHRGEPVRTQFRMPVSFVLNDD